MSSKTINDNVILHAYSKSYSQPADCMCSVIHKRIHIQSVSNRFAMIDGIFTRFLIYPYHIALSLAASFSLDYFALLSLNTAVIMPIMMSNHCELHHPQLKRASFGLPSVWHCYILNGFSCFPNRMFLFCACVRLEHFFSLSLFSSVSYLPPVTLCIFSVSYKMNCMWEPIEWDEREESRKHRIKRFLYKVLRSFFFQLESVYVCVCIWCYTMDGTLQRLLYLDVISLQLYPCYYWNRHTNTIRMMLFCASCKKCLHSLVGNVCHLMGKVSRSYHYIAISHGCKTNKLWIWWTDIREHSATEKRQAKATY